LHHFSAHSSTERGLSQKPKRRGCQDDAGPSPYAVAKVAEGEAAN